MKSATKEVCNLESLKEVLCDVKSEIVLYLAAQPIVRSFYKNLVHAYETNVMGTVNVCEYAWLTLYSGIQSFF